MNTAWLATTHPELLLICPPAQREWLELKNKLRVKDSISFTRNRENIGKKQQKKTTNRDLCQIYKNKQ